MANPQAAPTANLISTTNSPRIAELPWLDYASAAVPTDHNTVLWWAQYLWISNDNYRQALNRVTEHFLTDMQFPDLEPDEENELKEFFTQKLNYRSELGIAGQNFITYGNMVMGIYMPFRRMLRCQKCAKTTPITDTPYKLTLTAHEPFVIWNRRRACSCGDNRPFECVDLKDPDLGKVKPIFYSPFEIEIAYNRNSRAKEIWWKIDAEDRRDILSCVPIFVETTPLEVLEAVARNGNLKFDEGSVLHIDERVIAGIRTRGWGLPKAIASFRSAWLYQVINKADQAVASDYTLGMRVLSPAGPGATSQDPMQIHAMEGFASRIKNMVDNHRLDPTKYHAAPYPLQYTFMGGEGATLVPPEKLKFRQAEFLNGLGIPVEYHQMTLQTQAAPMALRLFEAAWQSIPNMYNQILGWMVEHLVKAYGLKKTAVSLQRSTIADDMLRKQVLTQLMGANQISAETALEAFGIDAREEVKKVYKHQDFIAKVQKETDEKAQKQQEMGAVQAMSGNPTPSMMAQQQQQAAQQGAAPPAGAPMGGMPVGGTGGQPTTIPEMSQQAEQMAQQLVTMPEGDRKTQLKGIRENNKDLHALVTSAMEKIRGQAASQGKQMVLQQGGPQPQ